MQESTTPGRVGENFRNQQILQTTSMISPVTFVSHIYTSPEFKGNAMGNMKLTRDIQLIPDTATEHAFDIFFVPRASTLPDQVSSRRDAIRDSQPIHDKAEERKPDDAHAFHIHAFP